MFTIAGRPPHDCGRSDLDRTAPARKQASVAEQDARMCLPAGTQFPSHGSVDPPTTAGTRFPSRRWYGIPDSPLVRDSQLVPNSGGMPLPHRPSSSHRATDSLTLAARNVGPPACERHPDRWYGIPIPCPRQAGVRSRDTHPAETTYRKLRKLRLVVTIRPADSSFFRSRRTVATAAWPITGKQTNHESH